MCCRIEELRDKQVICIKNAAVLGSVSDVEINTCDGKLTAIIVACRRRWFGLFGREDDLRIPWCDIEIIGCDTILVGCEPPEMPRRQRKFKNPLGGFGDGSY